MKSKKTGSNDDQLHLTQQLVERDQKIQSLEQELKNSQNQVKNLQSLDKKYENLLKEKKQVETQSQEALQKAIKEKESLREELEKVQKVDQSDVYAMNMVQIEDLKKKNILLELKLKQAEANKTSTQKLVQKSEEIDELKKQMKKLEEKLVTQKDELKKLEGDKQFQISKEEFDKVEMKYTAQ